MQKVNQSARVEAQTARKVEELEEQVSSVSNLGAGSVLRFRATTTKPSGVSHSEVAKEKGPSLYCFSLVLPFGYEPKLMKAQKNKKVGIFACEEWTVFSNATKLLDT